MDQLQDATYFIHKKYKIDKTIAEKELIEKLEKISEDKEIKKIVEKLSKYVAYRLLSPFYTKQIRGCKDSLKNSLILKLSNDDERAFYKIDKKKIILDPKWIKYFHENQVILEGWILYKLIFFLQKRNVGVPEIPFKISMPKNRNLNIARKFWKEIIDNKKENLENIYDDSVIEIENFSIDHFIPWSFILHDEIWNLVPTSKKINSSKNDNLPDLDSYLEKFCETQYVAYNYCNSKNKKKLEHYMTLVKGNPGIILEKEEFISKLRSEIIPLHQIAYNQGFPVWKYNQ